MNRLDGDAPGPVKVLVSNPVYSHDHQHVLIPEGTIVLGEAKKIGTVGFGQQRRMAAAFHRMIMPDGYSVELDQFYGLDQIGEEGLKDKVNSAWGHFRCCTDHPRRLGLWLQRIAVLHDRRRCGCDLVTQFLQLLADPDRVNAGLHGHTC
jgi:hypothetical protein